MNATQSTPDRYLFAFEAEVNRLINAAGFGVTEFFDHHDGMRSAKWTIAHFSYGQGKSAEQGAADWFDECVQPKLQRMDVPTPDAFTRAYIEAALWSSHDDEHESFDEFDIDDIAVETLRKIIADCLNFQAEHKADINAIPGRNGYKSAELAGHDFWLTRNGHGTGFWDRGLGELGGRLTDAAEAYGEVYLYIGDDGLIHLE